MSFIVKQTNKQDEIKVAGTQDTTFAPSTTAEDMMRQQLEDNDCLFASTGTGLVIYDPNGEVLAYANSQDTPDSDVISIAYYMFYRMT